VRLRRVVLIRAVENDLLLQCLRGLERSLDDLVDVTVAGAAVMNGRLHLRGGMGEALLLCTIIIARELVPRKRLSGDVSPII
jgi:hypothetical protein